MSVKRGYKWLARGGTVKENDIKNDIILCNTPTPYYCRYELILALAASTVAKLGIITYNNWLPML